MRATCNALKCLCICHIGIQGANASAAPIRAAIVSVLARVPFDVSEPSGLHGDNLPRRQILREAPFEGSVIRPGRRMNHPRGRVGAQPLCQSAKACRRVINPVQHARAQKVMTSSVAAFWRREKRGSRVEGAGLALTATGGQFIDFIKYFGRIV